LKQSLIWKALKNNPAGLKTVINPIYYKKFESSISVIIHLKFLTRGAVKSSLEQPISRRKQI
jgi:hypothetical protein